jgi:hypothetical protein
MYIGECIHVVSISLMMLVSHCQFGDVPLKQLISFSPFAVVVGDAVG